MQLKKNTKIIQWNIENIITTIKHLQINQISALNNLLGIDMLLNKLKKIVLNQRK